MQKQHEQMKRYFKLKTQEKKNQNQQSFSSAQD